MAYSTQRAVSDGSLVLLDISIDYFDRDEIAVFFDGILDDLPWAWVGSTDNKISFDPAVPDGVEVLLRRSTALDAPLHEFNLGAAFRNTTLDENFQQILRIAQEAKEGGSLGDIFNDLDMHGYQINNIGEAVSPNDAVPFSQFSVHDATIVGYKNAAEASAVEAAGYASSINPASFAAAVHTHAGLNDASTTAKGIVQLSTSTTSTSTTTAATPSAVKAAMDVANSKAFSGQTTDFVVTNGSGSASQMLTTGDLRASRGDNTGALLLNASGDRKLYFDGSIYSMPGAELYVNSSRVLKEGDSVLSKDMGHDAIGSLCFAVKSTAGGSYAPGSTIAGSDLRPVGVVGGSAAMYSVALRGTWRCLGYALGWSSPNYCATLWQRIS